MAKADSKTDSASWYAQNKRRKLIVYFDSEEQRDEWEELAKVDGYKRFSRWILDKAAIGIRGEGVDPGLLEAYKGRAEEMELARDYERQEANKHLSEKKDLEDTLRDLAESYAKLAQAVSKE